MVFSVALRHGDGLNLKPLIVFTPCNLAGGNLCDRNGSAAEIADRRNSLLVQMINSGAGGNAAEASCERPGGRRG
jgi:hypothetical protein